MRDTGPRYKIAQTTEQLCALVGIDPANVMRRMRRPADFLQNEGRGVTAQEFFEGWQAICDEANRPDLPLFLGQSYARGPFNPAFFAFTCSPSVQVGLERLSLFKPLSGPFALKLTRTDAHLRIVKTSNTPGIALPASFAATELVFLIEAMRTCTGAQIAPLSVTCPGPLECKDQLEAFLGCPITDGSISSMHLTLEDADRVLLSRNPEHWAMIEPRFKRDLEALETDQPIAQRVQSLLIEMLPAGETTIDHMANRLRMSTRSIQRHLKEEGSTYQSLLDSTRRGLALSYLQDTALNIDEISFLLAYRDPNSFYRAFQGWTGMTPLAARNAASPLTA